MASKVARDGMHGARAQQRGGAAQAVVTLTSVTVATANGSDAGTTQTLANSLKVQLNAVIADNVALKNLLHELRAALVEKGIITGA